MSSRDITLLTKVCLVKAVVFPVVMCGCESWTIKKAEHQRIDAFGPWCWRRLLRLPWTTMRSNQSILKEISPEYSLEPEAEAPVIWPPDAKNWLIGKDPDAEKDWRQEEKAMTEDEIIGWHHRLDGHEFEHTLGDSERQGSLACCSAWGCKESDMTETEQQQQILENTNGRKKRKKMKERKQQERKNEANPCFILKFILIHHHFS